MRRISPLLLIVLLAACSETPEPAAPLEASFSAQRLDQYNEREPFSMTLAYTCSPPTETVQLSGLLHTVSQMHVDGSGVQHWSFHSHPIQLRGTGTVSGREFRVVGAENTTRTIQVDGHRRFRQVAILRLMTPGEPAWTLHVHVDRERTPPGPWVYRIDRYDIACR
jgi:hypothetical protein